MKLGQQGFSTAGRGAEQGNRGPWPRLQKFWDIRAACNFIGGGTGAGLLLVAAIYALQDLDYRPLVVAGGLSISFGLLMVFLEIGRPWRSINMFFHPQTSWMTREGIVAIPLYLSMAVSVYFADQTVGLSASFISAVLAVGFLYCQVRILNAARGIPAWRHVAIKPYLLVTGVTEGLAVALCLPLVGKAAVTVALMMVLSLLTILRLGLWRRYACQLRRDGAPDASCNEIDRLNSWMILGNLLPVAGLLAAWWLDFESLILLAALVIAATGWYTKVVVVTRAAQLRGFMIPRTPVRGQGQSRLVGQYGFRQSQ